MEETRWIDPELIFPILALFGVVILAAGLLLVWVLWRVRRIELPVGADFWQTLRATPFVVVLLLDLLDLGLDFLSAPIAWVLLSRLGLLPLRAVTVVESVIPGTQFLPTMTVAWIIAKFFK